MKKVLALTEIIPHNPGFSFRLIKPVLIVMGYELSAVRGGLNQKEKCSEFNPGAEFSMERENSSVEESTSYKLALARLKGKSTKRILWVISYQL